MPDRVDEYIEEGASVNTESTRQGTAASWSASSVSGLKMNGHRRENTRKQCR